MSQIPGPHSDRIPKGGDLILVRRKAFGSAMIAWGQRRKFPRKYAFWSHCGIMVSSDHLAEALINGVVISPLGKYEDVPYTVVETTTSSEDRYEVVRFAVHAVGQQYGKAEILNQAMYLATGTKWRFCRNNQLICSAFAAESLSRTSAIFPEEPLFSVPAHLAQYYKAPYFAI